MTVHSTPLPANLPITADGRLQTYIATRDFEHPTLVLDIDEVEAQFAALKAGLGRASIFYAVKANPEPAVISRLVGLGSSFDAASKAEIALCLEQGASPDCVSFGNSIKKARDIAWAHEQGISLFAVDASEELEKIAENAPGAQVYIRLIVDNDGADWGLSRKFGCDAPMALDLLDQALALGLQPVGLSFHVGSQTREAAMWASALELAALVWEQAKAAGHNLSLLNIGGGFPAEYNTAIDAPQSYAADVMAQVEARFGDVPNIMAEPGRGLVASAGAIACEVVLVSRKSESDPLRWVYLDVGRFSGLAETEGEAIRYQIVTSRDGEKVGPCVLAGPTCDSADVMYENEPMDLPLALKAGDKVLIRNTGAYTATYSSVGFNGFAPLDVVVL